MSRPVPPEPPAGESPDPGLPGFHTWPAVYRFVLGCFVAYVVLLAVLTVVLA